MLRHVRGLIQRRCPRSKLASKPLLVLLLSLCLVSPLPSLAVESSGVSSSLVAASLALSAPERVREGNFQLTVEQTGVDSSDNNGELKPWVIEQSSNADFESVVASYAPVGSFQQLSLSGFDDGDYFFRARLTNEEVVSSVIRVEVRHYPLWQALSVFSVGAGLFLILCLTLWRLQRQTRLANQ